MQVAGTSGKVQQTADEDVEGISSDAHGAAITEALGMERRNEVTSSLYAPCSQLYFACNNPTAYKLASALTCHHMETLAILLLQWLLPVELYFHCCCGLWLP